MFIAKFGTAASNNTLQAQQDAASDMSGVQDLKDTKVTVGSSDEIVWLEIANPLDRHVRCQVQRGTSTTLDWCIAIQGGPKKLPVDNATAGTIAGELHVGPPEGVV